MSRAAAILVALLNTGLLLGQQAAAPAGQAIWPRAFDVASIKPVDKDKPLTWRGEEPRAGGRLSAIASAGDLIMFAFGVTRTQITGLPGWADSDLYAIEAVPPAGAPDLPQAQNVEMERPMVRALLEQYFHLKFRRAALQEEVLELVVAKGGAKLKPATAEEISARASAKAGAAYNQGMYGGRAWATAGQLSELAQSLAFDLQKRVLDRTGLTGYYDYTLTWMPGMGERMQRGAHGDGPSLYSELQRELGLQLRSTRAPVDMIVVDAIEPPAVGN